MTKPIDPKRTDPTDPLPPEKFSSWRSALEQNLLEPQQVAVLQTMVEEGHAKALEEAASILDLQEIIIHPREHMWGS
jgi:cobalamin biosynthesis protein CbiG